MLNIDELDAMCGREMNIVKSLLTSTDVNERAAYGRLKERRVRLVRGWLVYKRKQDEIEIKQKELANKSQRHEDILY